VNIAAITLALSTFGLILVYTPAAMAFLAGARSEEDLIQWLMSKPLEFIEALRAMQLSGQGVLLMSLAISYVGGA